MRRRRTGPNSRYRLLLEAARKARRNAYAPYSRYRVGAAVLAASGKIYAGCNVENASYGLTCCAERSAIFSAVSAGERRIRAIAVVLESAGKPAVPCGACRQVISEFGEDVEVVMGKRGLAYEAAPIRQLLPLAFGPRHLKKR